MDSGKLVPDDLIIDLVKNKLEEPEVLAVPAVDARAHRYTRAHAHHTHTYTRGHTQTHRHTDTETHECTHTRARARTHTRTLVRAQIVPQLHRLLLIHAVATCTRARQGHRVARSALASTRAASE